MRLSTARVLRSPAFHIQAGGCRGQASSAANNRLIFLSPSARPALAAHRRASGLPSAGVCCASLDAGGVLELHDA